MLRHLGEREAADLLFNAIRDVVGAGRDVTYDLGGTAGTREMGQAIARRIGELQG